MSRELGRWGEQMASRHYESLGYQILARNWHSRFGELDLVCARNDRIIFVEVKARQSLSFGSPEEALSKRQQLRIQRSALAFLQEKGLAELDWQIDFVAIERGDDGCLRRLDRYENAVHAQPLT